MIPTKNFYSFLILLTFILSLTKVAATPCEKKVKKYNNISGHPAIISGNYDLSLRLSVSNNCPNEGASFSFTITLTNEGDSTVTDVLVLDTLPSGANYLSHTPSSDIYSSHTGIWDIGTIAPKTTRTLTINCLAGIAGYYSNQAEIVRTGIGQDDWDSIPNNGSNGEDDFDKVCFSIPGILSCGIAYTITAPNTFTNYRWYKDSMLIIGENTPTLSVVESGSYIYTATELSNISCDNRLCPIKIIQDSCCTIVTNTNSTGVGSLAAAIDCANADPDLDTIILAIPETDSGFNDPTPENPGNGDEFWVINPIQPYQITAPAFIDGLKQPNSSCGAPRIIIDGINMVEGASIFNLLPISNGTTIQGFSLVNAPDAAIRIDNSHKNHVRCNFIGLLVDGKTENGNGTSGVKINTLSSSNLIGGTSFDRNIISGNNLHGVFINTTAFNNIVSGNWIGIDISGLLARPNLQDGIHIKGFNNRIGGVDSDSQNIISGNNNDGIELNGLNAFGNIIRINAIGATAK